MPPLNTLPRELLKCVQCTRTFPWIVGRSQPPRFCGEAACKTEFCAKLRRDVEAQFREWAMPAYKRDCWVLMQLGKQSAGGQEYPIRPKTDRTLPDI